MINREKDTFNAPNAERLAMDLPNVEAVIIDDVGHLCNLQALSAYTDPVCHFVKELYTKLKRDTSL